MRGSVLLAAAVLLVPISTPWSATISVRADGTGDYPTIQDAINAASDGDSIVLAPGTFTGSGNRGLDTAGKAVVITSRHGPDATEIDAEWQSPVFGFHQGETSTTVISNIAIIRGYATGAFGAAIECHGGSPLLSDLVFGPNTGLGLAIVDGNVDVVRCRFVEDAFSPAPVSHGSAMLVDHAGARLVGCYFSGYDFGVIRGSNASIAMIGNTVKGNGDGAAEGLLVFENCAVSVLGNTVASNRAHANSGMYFWQCTGEVRGNWIEGNRANLAGGGLNWEESAGDVSFNLLRENDDGGIDFMRSTGSIWRNLVVRIQGGCCSSGTAVEAHGCESIVIENNTLYRNGDEYDLYSPPYSAAEIVFLVPWAQVNRNVLVGKSDYPWVVCDNTPGGCATALAMDTVYVDDPSNSVFGDGQGLYETLSNWCHVDYPEYLDPLFRSPADDNFFLRPESLAMIDTVVGSWHIKRSWGALPKGSGPSSVLDVQTPAPGAPPGLQPGSRFPLAGFSITNTSTLDAVVNYRLFVSGGTLHDNGDPLSLVGTTPVLAAGGSFAPPPAAVVVPAGYANVEVKFAYAYAPAVHMVDTVRTNIHFGPPVSVRVTSFEARVEEAGVRLHWETAAGTGEIGWLMYRAEGEGDYKRVTASPLPPHDRSFLDASARPGNYYHYRLVALAPEEIVAAEIVVAPKARLVLEQNAPNPFNPETTIQFSLSSPAHTVLAVYGVDGAHIRTIVERNLAGGVYRETWDGRDARGNVLSSGIYFCRLTVGNRTLTRKMVLAR